MNIHNDQVVINTKVSAEAFARIQSICKAKGLTMYNLLQMFADIIIRYMDDEHNLSADLQRVVRMFEGMNGWRDSCNLADSMKDIEAVEAIYIIRRPDRKGARLVKVEPLLGEPHATYNIQQIVDRVIEVANPSLHRHLRMLSADMGTDSMIDTMGRLADLYKENPDETELRAMFESNNWSENARQHDGQVYRRKVSASMEDYERLIYEQGY